MVHQKEFMKTIGFYYILVTSRIWKMHTFLWKLINYHIKKIIRATTRKFAILNGWKRRKKY